MGRQPWRPSACRRLDPCGMPKASTRTLPPRNTSAWSVATSAKYVDTSLTARPLTYLSGSPLAVLVMGSDLPSAWHLGSPDWGAGRGRSMHEEAIMRPPSASSTGRKSRHTHAAKVVVGEAQSFATRARDAGFGGTEIEAADGGRNATPCRPPRVRRRGCATRSGSAWSQVLGGPCIQQRQARAARLREARDPWPGRSS